MTVERRIIFSSLASLVLVSALCALPLPHHVVASSVSGQDAVQMQQVSGKIASLDKDSFTLTVSATGTGGMQLVQETTPKNMKFMIDQNTTVEGKMKVGANAEVTYRQDNGQNLAISVKVAE